MKGCIRDSPHHTNAKAMDRAVLLCSVAEARVSRGDSECVAGVLDALGGFSGVIDLARVTVQNPEPVRLLTQLASVRPREVYEALCSSDMGWLSTHPCRAESVALLDALLQTATADAPDEFLCPITREVMTDPVADPSGHTFERSAIKEWLTLPGTKCPTAREELGADQLFTHLGLHNEIEQWRCDETSRTKRLLGAATCFAQLRERCGQLAAKSVQEDPSLVAKLLTDTGPEATGPLLDALPHVSLRSDQAKEELRAALEERLTADNAMNVLCRSWQLEDRSVYQVALDAVGKKLRGAELSAGAERPEAGVVADAIVATGLAPAKAWAFALAFSPFGDRGTAAARAYLSGCPKLVSALRLELLSPEELDATVAGSHVLASSELSALKAAVEGSRSLDATAMSVSVLGVTLEVRPPNQVTEGFVLVKAGSFTMGSPPDEEGRFPDEVEHRVKLTHDYQLKATPVTEGEWQDLMRNNPSRRFSGRPSGESANDCPVQNVSWFDAVAYCNKLSARDKLTPCYTLSDVRGTPGTGSFECKVQFNPDANGYRLPTEAEWEFAARGEGRDGSSTNSSTTHAWYSDNSEGRTRPVESKPKNGLGAYGMLGNVYEWTADWWGDYARPRSGHRSVVDPRGPESGGSRVFRGGSWRSRARFVRAAVRSLGGPSCRGDGLGFRPVRSHP
jgi:formylglycine-generating enzyme required for sulfatase activity